MRRHSDSLLGAAAGLALLAGLALGAARAQAAQDAEPGPGESRFAGKTLQAALRELQSRGLNIVFTTRVVRPEMRVGAEPAAVEPRAILEELLTPHGLMARDGPNATVVVVPRPSGISGVETAITGFVGSRRDSAPVDGVTLRLLDTDSQVSSGGDGRFLLPTPGAGTFDLEVRRRGFVVERIENVVVTAGAPAEISILLDPAPVTEEEVVVTPSRVSLLRQEPVAPLALSRDDILALPQLGGDFFRALTLLPGISGNDVSADFHVRGGRRDETQILLDGQELYETYHLKDYDNALSIVAPATLDSVDLSTGGFGAEHGDRMSGVLDMTTLTPAGPRRAWVGLGILNGQAGGAGTFGQGRGSWLGQGRFGSTKLTTKIFRNDDTRYWDAFGKLGYQLNPRSSLRANFLHADDALNLTELSQETLKRIETDYRSSYLWLTHQVVLGSRLFFDTAISQSLIDRDRRGLEIEEDVQFEIRDQRDLEVLALRQAWSFQASARHYLRWGFGLRGFDTRYDYVGTRSFDNPLAEIRDDSKDSTIFRQRFEEEHNSLYLSDRIQISDPLTLELGLRFDRHTQTDESHLSPRFNLAWAVGRSGVVRFAWGRFNQSQRPYELQVEDGDTRFFPVERSEHRVIGFERLFEPAGDRQPIALRLELYQREVSNPLPRFENLYEPINEFPEVEPDRVRIAPDRSVAEGVELFLRGRLGRRIGWWMNYAYSSTEDELGGRRQPRQFDQPHALNLNLDFLLGDHWHVGVAWLYHTGWPTTPLSLAEVVNADGEAEFVPVLGELFSDRFPAYHRLDLRASRRWQLSAGALELHIDIQNVYDRGNAAGFDYQVDEQEGLLVSVREDWAGFLPSFGVTFEF